MVERNSAVVLFIFLSLWWQEFTSPIRKESSGVLIPLQNNYDKEPHMCLHGDDSSVVGPTAELGLVTPADMSLWRLELFYSDINCCTKMSFSD